MSERGVLIRLVYLLVALGCWLATAGGRTRRERAVVLCYHGVTPAQRERFRRQLRHVAARAIPAQALGAAGPRGGLPRVCVTFDDAFENLRSNALPLARELGVPVTVFAVSGNLGRPPAWAMSEDHVEAHERTMTAEELASEARAPGCRIGSHTLTHAPLDRLGPEALARELCESRSALEVLVGAPVVDLAFPHGAYDERVRERALAAGYARLFTLDPCLHPGPLAAGLVGRFLMSPDAWPLEFRLASAGAYGWLHGLRRALRRLRAPRGAVAAASGAPVEEERARFRPS